MTAKKKAKGGRKKPRIGALAGTASLGFSNQGTLTGSAALAGKASFSRGAGSERRTAANRANASMPRKKWVTKDALEAYRDARKRTYGTTRGWKDAACRHFGITIKTLNKKVE